MCVSPSGTYRQFFLHPVSYFLMFFIFISKKGNMTYSFLQVFLVHRLFSSPSFPSIHSLPHATFSKPCYHPSHTLFQKAVIIIVDTSNIKVWIQSAENTSIARSSVAWNFRHKEVRNMFLKLQTVETQNAIGIFWSLSIICAGDRIISIVMTWRNGRNFLLNALCFPPALFLYVSLQHICILLGFT